MNKDKHTPGPWKARVLERQGFEQYPLGYKAVFEIEAINDKGQSSAGTFIGFGGQGEENAALISAAPEMLDALEDLDEIMDFINYDSLSHWPAKRVRELTANIEKVIKKAKGET
jgi:hypothetical protein